eukprot:3098325-Amphidinium_carterae.1
MIKTVTFCGGGVLFKGCSAAARHCESSLGHTGSYRSLRPAMPGASAHAPPSAGTASVPKTVTRQN